MIESKLRIPLYISHRLENFYSNEELKHFLETHLTLFVNSIRGTLLGGK